MFSLFSLINSGIVLINSSLFEKSYKLAEYIMPALLETEPSQSSTADEGNFQNY